MAKTVQRVIPEIYSIFLVVMLNRTRKFGLSGRDSPDRD